MSTDFQIAPVEEPAPTPAPPAAPAAAQVAPAPVPAKPVRELAHTPGGLPAIPLAVITGNTAIAGLSGLAVTAGPVAAAAAAGSVLVGTVAVKAAGARKARKAPRTPNRPRPVQKQPSARQAPTGSRNSSGAGQRSAGGAGRTTTSPSTGTRPAPASRTTNTRKTNSNRPATPNSGARTNAPKTNLTKKPTAGGTFSPNTSRKQPPTSGPGSRATQIKNLRKDKQAATPSKRERRTKDLTDRRSLRDARRQAKRNARDLKRNARKNGPTETGPGNGTSPTLKKKQDATAPITPKGKGQATDTLRPARRPGFRGWAGAQADKARTRLRATRDKATDNRTTRIQQARRKAKAGATLAKSHGRAHGRYGLQAAGRALLAAPVGLLGCLTTPIGRRFGWTWAQHPGRRLYRHLTAAHRAKRDAHLAHAKNTYANDTNPNSPQPSPDQQPIADTVARAPRTGNTPDLGDTTDMSEDIKLHFLETSEETVSAARAYEPGGMLHVRQVIKAMPVALENWAQAFAVLAEKSDAEFPLGDEIGEGMDDIHQQMRQLIAHAEELAQTFDRIHEADIDRLINPRKSRDAEKTWDTTANEDYDD